MKTEDLILLIRETRDSLKCPRDKLKGFNVEDRHEIIMEESGYDILADALIRRLRDVQEG